MNEKDRELLNLAQGDFPLRARPFKELGDKLGLSEDDVLARLRQLKKEGIIRRIGGVFDSQHLGYTSCLIAAKVPDDKLQETAEYVNRFPGVTHNYQRTHAYNLWFTLTASSEEVFNRIIGLIKENTAAEDIRLLPAVQIFQTEVKFKM